MEFHGSYWGCQESAGRTRGGKRRGALWGDAKRRQQQFGTVYKLKKDGTGYTNLHTFATSGDGHHQFRKVGETLGLCRRSVFSSGGSPASDVPTPLAFRTTHHF